ncbi:MAG: L,D-transpeptidase family protein [Candidatus Methylacidiphilales bacterium]|nr:L,D-transpeptidase family protein [Candidatus Methylacidiphilales bacterium]
MPAQPRKGKYKNQTVKVAPAQPIFDWFGDHDVTIDYIELRLEEQKLYAFSKGQAVAWSEISTGREGYDTPAGEYKILQKNAGHKSNLYGYIVEVATDKVVVKDANPKTPVPPGCKYEAAAMPFFLRLTNTGIGLHAGYLPGYAASHGCIRLPYDMIEAIYDRTKVGTRVVILPRNTPAVDAGLTTAAVVDTPPPAPSPSASANDPAIQPYSNLHNNPSSYTQQNAPRRRGTQSIPSETEERIILERPE